MEPLNARFQEYYGENYPMVRKIALSIVKNRAAADDVTSEVFTCLYEYLARENPPDERIRSWLPVTARYRACSYLRGSGCQNLTKQAPQAESFSGPDADSRLFVSDFLEALYRRNPKWFDVVEKYYYLGLSAEEIAREYRCTPRAVLSALSRARKYLREKFGADFRG